MIFVREASATVVLVTFTLSLQCACMAMVIAWARPRFALEVLRLGAIRSAILVMRLMTAFIGLHLLEILLWAGFYRWRCFTSWESAFYFSAASYADRWLRRCRSSVDLADLVSSGKHHWRADVRVVGELPVRHRGQASRP
jgi:hypothetical protein